MLSCEKSQFQRYWFRWYVVKDLYEKTKLGQKNQTEIFEVDDMRILNPSAILVNSSIGGLAESANGVQKARRGSQ